MSSSPAAARRAAPGRLGGVLGALPTGESLSPESWHGRHLWICRVLWTHVVGLTIYGLAQGVGAGHALLEGGVLVAGLAALASSEKLDDPVRSLIATLGLVTSSAVLVHFSGGLIEMHFHFFVVVVIVSLYQSWRPFLLALGVVVLHHGIAGSLDPASVYNHPSAIEVPWLWALIHAAFILAESAACLAAWRLNEDALVRERGARHELAAAQQLAAVGSWEWDLRAGELTWSAELYRILGIDPGVTPTTATFLAAVHPDDHDRVAGLVEAAPRPTSGDLDYECRIVRPDGTTRTIHALGNLVTETDATPVKMIGTCQDVTEREALEQEITYRAFYDGLTGLANRALFLDRVEAALTRRKRTQAPTAVLYVNLDGFKAVNDTLGHRAGDELLIEVARRLRSAGRDADTVARLAGDEFALLLEGADASAAVGVAERVAALLAAPVILDERRHDVTASIGVADTAYAAASDELLHHADVAMYTAKRHAGSAYEVFVPAMTELVGRQATLKSELRDAVADGQLVLHYQPIVDLATGATESVEALVRWNHPRFGLLAPTEFIGLAEQTGHIVPLGTWVTHEATRQAAELQRRLGFPVRVSVNLAAQQLDGDLEGTVRSALTRAGLAPSQLTLELTETSLMSRQEGAIAKLQSLRDLGVLIAIDDFGTGYSSLAYLKQLPIDILKIDRAFIQSIAEGPAEAGLAHAIIELAGIFGMRTIAEGIETAEQAATLRELGCHAGQGYLYSRPVPAEDLVGWSHLPAVAVALP